MSSNPFAAFGRVVSDSTSTDAASAESNPFDSNPFAAAGEDGAGSAAAAPIFDSPAAPQTEFAVAGEEKQPAAKGGRAVVRTRRRLATGATQQFEFVTRSSAAQDPARVRRLLPTYLMAILQTDSLYLPTPLLTLILSFHLYPLIGREVPNSSIDTGVPVLTMTRAPNGEMIACQSTHAHRAIVSIVDGALVEKRRLKSSVRSNIAVSPCNTMMALMCDTGMQLFLTVVVSAIKGQPEREIHSQLLDIKGVCTVTFVPDSRSVGGLAVLTTADQSRSVFLFKEHDELECVKVVPTEFFREMFFVLPSQQLVSLSTQGGGVTVESLQITFFTYKDGQLTAERSFSLESRVTAIQESIDAFEPASHMAVSPDYSRLYLLAVLQRGAQSFLLSINLERGADASLRVHPYPLSLHSIGCMADGRLLLAHDTAADSYQVSVME